MEVGSDDHRCHRSVALSETLTMKLISWVNAISAQTWSVIFVLLGAGLSLNPHSHMAGSLLVGGGLALLRLELPGQAPSSPKSPKSE